ncbi:hypothetical protein HYPP_02388 [Hyphomicrobium sp. ghe19]|nr:hypothetical protein HYPP_02388 [Hyphomicrobium sp. ghe19]
MPERYPDKWQSSEDFTERFCAHVEMMTRNIFTARDLAESIAWIASYRRTFYAGLKSVISL